MGAFLECLHLVCRLTFYAISSHRGARKSSPSKVKNTLYAEWKLQQWWNGEMWRQELKGKLLFYNELDSMSYRQTFCLRGVETKRWERKLVTLALCQCQPLEMGFVVAPFPTQTFPWNKHLLTPLLLIWKRSWIFLLWLICRHLWDLNGGQQNYNGDWYYLFKHGADIKFYPASSTNQYLHLLLSLKDHHSFTCQVFFFFFFNAIPHMAKSVHS